MATTTTTMTSELYRLDESSLSGKELTLLKTMLQVFESSAIPLKEIDTSAIALARKTLANDLALSKTLSQRKNFYVHWAVIKFMLRIYHDVLEKLQPRAQAIIPGMLPALFEYCTTYHAGVSHPNVATDAKRFKDALSATYKQWIEQNFNQLNQIKVDILNQRSAITGVLDENVDALALASFKLNMVMNRNNLEQLCVESYQRYHIDSKVRGSNERADWSAILDSFDQAGLQTRYDEVKADAHMVQVNDFLQKYPVMTFVSCYNYSSDVESPEPINPSVDITGLNPAPHVLQLLQLQQPMHAYPWELCIDPRGFEADGDEAKIDQPTLQSITAEFTAVSNMVMGFVTAVSLFKLLDSTTLTATSTSENVKSLSHLFGRFLFNGMIHMPQIYTTTKDFVSFRIMLTELIKTNTAELDNGKEEEKDQLASYLNDTTKTTADYAKEFVDGYDQHIVTYSANFFEHLDRLLEFAADNPYVCKTTQTLKDSLQLALNTEEGKKKVIREFYHCVKTVANDFVIYASVSETRTMIDNKYNAIVAKIAEYEAAGQPVPPGLRHDETGEILIDGCMPYNICAEEMDNAEADCKPLKQLILVVEERLPEIASGLNLAKKYACIRERVEKVNTAYAEGKELTPADYETLAMERNFILLLKNVIVTCAQAAHYVCSDDYKEVSQKIMELIVPKFRANNSLEEMGKFMMENLGSLMSTLNSGGGGDKPKRSGSAAASSDQLDKPMLLKFARFSSMLQRFMLLTDKEDDKPVAGLAEHKNKAVSSMKTFEDAIKTFIPNNPLYISDDEDEMPKRAVGFMSDD